MLQRGRRTTARGFVVFVRAPEDPSDPRSETRLGITVSRRVGNAVVRNRVKRRVREWFRRERGELVKGSEIVVIGRREAAKLSGPEIDSSLDLAVSRSRRAAS